jgi:hypothetical protein
MHIINYSILTSGSYVLVSVHIKGTTQHGAAPPHEVGGRQPVSHKFMAESSAEIIYMDMLIEYNGEDCQIHRILTFHHEVGDQRNRHNNRR